jgi:VanZ family protein
LAYRTPTHRTAHRSSATVLALLCVLVVVYASLYPFTQWRDQGLGPFDFLTAPWPRYWSKFDTAANWLGYMPLGFLVTLALLRSTMLPQPVLIATALLAALSLCMEALQTYLPQRVPALSDWLLNGIGALTGAWLADVLEKLGAIDHWSRFRARWFVRDARPHLVLLAIWPVALLFPPAVALSLGQVFERVEAALAQALAGTPFLEWLPLRTVELQPITALGEVLCVALGLLIPCLLGYAAIKSTGKRAVLWLLVCTVAVLASSLSAALSYGPDSAWEWLSRPVEWGLMVGGAIAAACVLLRPRTALALLLLTLAWQLSLINTVPSTPYFAQTLQDWEQGQFIRFHGLAQWLGWVWPYVALWVAIRRLSQRDSDAL